MTRSLSRDLRLYAMKMMTMMRIRIPATRRATFRGRQEIRRTGSDCVSPHTPQIPILWATNTLPLTLSHKHSRTNAGANAHTLCSPLLKYPRSHPPAPPPPITHTHPHHSPPATPMIIMYWIGRPNGVSYLSVPSANVRFRPTVTCNVRNHVWSSMSRATVDLPAGAHALTS